MTMDFFNIALTVGSFIAAVMLLTGHGSVLMKGGNAQERHKKYDEKKMERACGVAFLLVGIVSAIDCFTKTYEAKIAYLVVLIVIFAGLIFYIRKKCILDK